MPPPLTHEVFRKRVCGVCWTPKKKGTQEITQSILQDIRNHQYQEYSLTNPALSLVICASCRLKLSRCRKVWYSSYNLCIICGFLYQNPDDMTQCVTGTDYTKLTPPPVRTRSSTDTCHCYLCTKGRDTLVPFTLSKSNPKPAPVKICTECKGEIAPGVYHVCTRAERNNNLIDMLRSASGRSRGQIVSETLKGR